MAPNPLVLPILAIDTGCMLGHRVSLKLSIQIDYRYIALLRLLVSAHLICQGTLYMEHCRIQDV
jgi:hypothetical protein